MVYSVIGSLAVIGVLGFSGLNPILSTGFDTSPTAGKAISSDDSPDQALITEIYEYKGNEITSGAFIALNEKGIALQTVYSQRGDITVVTAFDTIEEADAYVQEMAAGKRADLTNKSFAAASESTVSPMGTVGGCPNVTYGSRDYVDGGCGGSYLAFSPNDAVANFGTFGLNDKISSYTIAPGTTSNCLITKRYYSNANYDVSAGTWTVMGEFYAYTSGNFSSVQNDKVSSEKSTCS